MLKPIDSIDQEKLNDPIPPEITEDVLAVGGPYVMNEVAVYMENDDVLATVGTFPDSCIILTDLPRSRCEEIIKIGKDAFDRKTREAIKNNGELEYQDN
jgi:hypothetical protein